MTAPPVRSSVDDPHIDWSIASRTMIFLDGIEQRQVLSYDCAAGTLERYATGPAGNLIIKGDELRVENLTGVVSVGWKQP